MTGLCLEVLKVNVTSFNYTSIEPIEPNQISNIFASWLLWESCLKFDFVVKYTHTHTHTHTKILLKKNASLIVYH